MLHTKINVSGRHLSWHLIEDKYYAGKTGADFSKCMTQV